MSVTGIGVTESATFCKGLIGQCYGQFVELKCCGQKLPLAVRLSGAYSTKLPAKDQCLCTGDMCINRIDSRQCTN